MSFVMPSKYGPDLPQAKDPSVTIKEVPSKIIAVVAFPGSSCNLLLHFQLSIFISTLSGYLIAFSWIKQESV
jgi:hypothetical protein